MHFMTTATFAPEAPSPVQRGLDRYDQDTIAYLEMLGVPEQIVQRVADSLRAAKSVAS